MEDELSVSDLFERFIEATTMKNVMTIHTKILDFANLQPCEFNIFFPRYKRAVTSNRQRKNWKAKALFSKIEKRANHKCYSNTKAPHQQQQQQQQLASNNCDTTLLTENGMDESWSSQSNARLNININNINNNNNNNALRNYKSLVIGSGPAGLRTAIELQLLGAERVVIVEKRNRFSRNNVLHLWPFVIDDLKSLGAKKFYGKFCAGSIDHISIRQLQLILLKVCLMIGCDFRDSCSYISLCPSSIRKEIILSSDNDNLKEISDTCECKLTNGGGHIEKEQEHQQQANNVRVASNDIHEETNNTQAGPGGETDCDSNQKQQQQEVASLGPEVTTTTHQRSPTRQKKPVTLDGASAHFECDRKTQEEELHSLKWDVIIGADGRRNTLKNFFPRKEFRGRLAIAITANFINRQTTAETSVPEISGLSFIYNQDMFNALAYDTNIVLENICYYKDDTHYFVMTAKKKSLLERGVLIRDYAATQDLLAESNVNRANLLKYAKDVAYWTTGLEPLDFALNHYGQEDCAMFDFTSMYAATNACKALRTRQGGLTLVGLVGDSLLEPFWPTGSGCARGFLSSFDAAWMCRQWAVNKCAVLDYHSSATSRFSRNRNSFANGNDKALFDPTTYDRMALSVMAERESIYRILAQTTSENLQQNYSHWTLNPHTRYPHLNRTVILPSQVEHLIADGTRPPPIDRHLLSSSGSQNGRRVKSPNGTTKSRRSPKKLKSAGASPSSQPRYSKNNSKHLYRQGQKSKSRHDIVYDEYYHELEESYRNLADTEKGGMTQYLNYKRRDSSGLDDLFIPSISGTLPSSNNLSRLEARKARDIDECLRQRRQKTKITLVRDQLISQMRGENQKDKDGAPLFSGGNAALFNEIKRMREQQSRGIRADSKPRDNVTGPLSLLNSMRRCASFAERVKSFESKLTNQDSAESSNVSTPKTPIENVKNLPQFATLQELIISNSQKSDADQTRRSQMPIAKLTKEDWNVKCWENRLSACKQKHLSISSRSLNKSVSVDSDATLNNRFNKPQKQVEVFQDRIMQMANKLESTKEKQAPLKIGNQNKATSQQQPAAASVRSQGWVNHLKRELAKGSESCGRKLSNGQPILNPATNQPIRKLFDDDDDDDDGIDVNKHYDHLCINRPTNKYLVKGAYTSHLARSSNATSKVINRPNPSAENKQAYLAALTSRGSSASSTLSDYSTNTGHSSSESGGNKQSSSPSKASVIDVECFRCRKFVSSVDRITIGGSLLHRSCLTCAKCGLTLKSNEIQHYMASIAEMRAKNENTPVDEEIKFMCNLCSPEIRVAISREADKRLAKADEYQDLKESSQRQQQQRYQSREAFFLNSRINYNDIYKNILGKEQKKIDGAEGKENRATSEIVCNNDNSSSCSSSRVAQARPAKVTPNYLQVTIPMRAVNDGNEPSVSIIGANRPMSDTGNSKNDTEVTLILPAESATPSSNAADPDEETLSCKSMTANSRRESSERRMIDEEELERILHLDKRESGRKSSATSTSADGSSGSSSNGSSTDEDAISKEDDDDSSSLDDVEDDDENDDDDDCDHEQVHTTNTTVRGSSSRNHKLQPPSQETTADNETSDSDGSSSLDLPPDTDEYEDDNDTTCDDFITTEEFDAPSDEEPTSTGVPHGTARESESREMSAS